VIGAKNVLTFRRPQPAARRSLADPAPTVTAAEAARFREIMLPLMDSAHGYARYLSRDPVAAEDIVQEAYLRAFRAFGGWRGEAAKPWLLAIVRNCFLTSVRGRPTETGVAAGSAEATDGVRRSVADLQGVDHNDPEAALLRRGDVDAVRAALDALPDLFREILVLRELQGLTYNEIAVQVAAPVGTVMSRLARGRRMLAERLHPAAAPQGETLS
jgi:RNA polymerase sigma factor (sigma-70 family)